ncbi:MAG TPA: septum formation initiator family protein [Chitinophagaceae bacterium]|nr:septum formation initiator family protein [Chitinophagaceae bacterium]
MSFVAFLLWILFFDRNDIFSQMERKEELRKLQESKRYFTQQITEERAFSEELKNNPAAIEKFAREKYGMKKDGEDLYLIQPLENKK